VDLFGYFTWKVEFDGDKPGPEGDFNIHFQDRQLFLNDFKEGVLVAQFMDDVMKQVEAQEHYEIVGNIKKITDPEDRDITGVGEIVAILATHNEAGKICFLLGYNKADVWETLGLYPEQYARAVKGDKRVLDTYLEKLALKPDEWDNVFIVK
jgi:hypothetical protein